MYTERKAGKLLSLIFLATTYFGMFLSGGRKYIVVPILFLYIMMMNKTDKKGRAHLIRNTLIVILVAVAVFLLIMKVPYFYEHIGNRFEDFFGLFDETKSADGSTLLRTKMAKAGMEKWIENPLFGYGFDSFKYYNASSVTGHLYYSHNNFVELLYNQGVIGFIAYYAFYVYLVVKAMKIRPRSLYKGFVIGTVISLLLFEFFGITYSVTPIQFLLFFCFYCLNRGLKENPAKQKTKVER